MTTTATSRARRGWLGPAGLILLSAIPVLAGGVRVGQLAGGAEITPENARFFASPLPMVLHIGSASVYCVLGASQWVIRRRPTTRPSSPQRTLVLMEAR